MIIPSSSPPTPPLLLLSSKKDSSKIKSLHSLVNKLILEVVNEFSEFDSNCSYFENEFQNIKEEDEILTDNKNKNNNFISYSVDKSIFDNSFFEFPKSPAAIQLAGQLALCLPISNEWLDENIFLELMLEEERNKKKEKNNNNNNDEIIITENEIQKIKRLIKISINWIKESFGDDSQTLSSSDLSTNKIDCNCCQSILSTNQLHIRCLECDDYDLCVECFVSGRQTGNHLKTHYYTPFGPFHTVLYSQGWTGEEEAALLESVCKFGFGNWDDVSSAVANASPLDYKIKKNDICENRYFDFHIPLSTGKAEIAMASNFGNDASKVPKFKYPYSYLLATPIFKQWQIFANLISALPLEDPSSSSPLISSADEIKNENKINNNNFKISNKTATLSDDQISIHSINRQKQKQINKLNRESSSSFSQSDLFQNNKLNKYQFEKLSVVYPPEEISPLIFEPPEKVPKSSILNYTPLRGEFDVEFDNSAEFTIADLEFRLESDSPLEIEFKLSLLEMYNCILDERIKRKSISLSKCLYDSKVQQHHERFKSQDEKNMSNILKPLFRFSIPDYRRGPPPFLSSEQKNKNDENKLLESDSQTTESEINELICLFCDEQRLYNRLETLNLWHEKGLVTLEDVYNHLEKSTGTAVTTTAALTVSLASQRKTISENNKIEIKEEMIKDENNKIEILKENIIGSQIVDRNDSSVDSDGLTILERELCRHLNMTSNCFELMKTALSLQIENEKNSKIDKIKIVKQFPIDELKRNNLTEADIVNLLDFAVSWNQEEEEETKMPVDKNLENKNKNENDNCEIEVQVDKDKDEELEINKINSIEETENIKMEIDEDYEEEEEEDEQNQIDDQNKNFDDNDMNQMSVFIEDEDLLNNNIINNQEEDEEDDDDDDDEEMNSSNLLFRHPTLIYERQSINNTTGGKQLSNSQNDNQNEEEEKDDQIKDNNELIQEDYFDNN